MKLLNWLKKHPKSQSKKDCHRPTPPMEKGYMHAKIESNWHNRMNSTQKKMSQGAQQLFRVIKCRCRWGNKQLWGSHEKGRGKSGHRQPK